MNLSTMTNIFKSIVSCDDLEIQEPFESVSFGYTFFEA